MGIWSFWLILAIGFFISEVFTLSLTCLYIGIGALAATVSAIAGCEWTGSIIAFLVATFVVFMLTFHWRETILQRLHKNPASSYATGMESLIGRTGKVEQLNGKLKVRIDGDIWDVAPSDSGKTLLPDSQVRITGYDSIVLKAEVYSNQL